MNYKDHVIDLLRRFSRKDIIITAHTLIRLEQRQIDKEEVIENIINPKRLKIAIKEQDTLPGEEKFDCYF
jgi:hypothetical protein